MSTKDRRGRGGDESRLGELQVVEALGITVSELRVWCDAGWVTPVAHGRASGGTAGVGGVGTGVTASAQPHLGGRDSQDAARGGSEDRPAGDPVFDEVDVARLRLVRELRDDLGLDAGAIPVVLSLIDQLYGVRRELRALAGAVDRQDRAVAARIRADYRKLAGSG